MCEREMVCIVCPVGCNITVTKTDDGIKVRGNQCPRGDVYGKNEVTNPKRVLPTTVRIENGILPRLPVKTADEIPKSLIFEAMKVINSVVVNAPVKVGDVIIKDILGTGVDVVASRDMQIKHIG